MKDELKRKIITEFVALIPRIYSYLTDYGINFKKSEGTKKCVTEKLIKHILYVNCLFRGKSGLQSQQRFKSEPHNVYTIDINKIALRNYKHLLILNHSLMVQVLEKCIKQSY